mgnify:CR=1 FL=1
MTQDENGVLYAACSGHRSSHVCTFGKDLMFTSTDGGETWSETPDVSFTGLDAEGVAIDKATINGNYTENYYDFGKVLENVTAIKIVVNNGELYQISELIFWQG